MSPALDSVRLLVARHAETSDNAIERWQGWNDSPLTPLGVAQAEASARRLTAEPVTAIYASDLGRAAHTARIVAAPHGLTPYLTPALRERNVGVFSGLTGPRCRRVTLKRWHAASSTGSSTGLPPWISRKSKVESRKSKVESRKSKVESRKSKVESRKSKVESRKSG